MLSTLLRRLLGHTPLFYFCALFLYGVRCDGAILFSNMIGESGTGFGNVLNVLSVHEVGNTGANGTAGDEFGSVLYNGSTDVLSGDATNTSATRTVAELTSIGINASNLAVVFNINEPGNQNLVVLTLQDFDFVFQDAAGTELFRETYTAPIGGLPLDAAGQGTGSSGWVFPVSFANPVQAANFFATSTSRLGAEVAGTNTIFDVAGGAENFFVTALPEPSASFMVIAICMYMYRRTSRSSSLT